MIFADADNDSDAYFVILGIPYEDREMSFRSGTSKAPDYIRELSYNYESYDIFSDVDLMDVPVHDAGNFGLNEAEEYIIKAVKNNKLPISIGGAHSITPFIVPYDEIDGVVILDAHADFRDEYLNDKSSHACASRRIFETIGKEKLLSYGIRSISKEEVEDAKKLGYKFITSKQFRAEMADEIEFERIYLSVDMDVFDPCYAPGVSNPEPMGLGYEVFDFVKRIAGEVIAMDVVEVSPQYDNGMAGLLAAKLIRDFIAWKWRE